MIDDENAVNDEQGGLVQLIGEAREDEASFEIGFDSGEESEESAIQEVIQANPSLSEEQVRELFEQNNQRIFGKFGEVQRNLQEVRQLASAARQEYVPQNVQVTAENFGKVREEFGEEFAAALAADLASIQMHQVQTGANQAQIDAYINQRLESANQQFETKLVALVHPDWNEIAQSEQFIEWKSKQPEPIQDLLTNSYDSEFIITALGAFKQQTSRKEVVTKQRTDRLAAAVTPQSSGGGSYEADDDFEAGFNS